MFDDNQNQGAGPENDFESSAALPPPVPEIPSRPFSYWVKRLLACNPFYLFSAALLMYGMYRISLDPHILKAESAQLIFNFTSLQVYELLLAGTAIFLARRLIWYDATLLVFLENLFVLIPFMLVSQAGLIENRAVWVLCVVAATLVLFRLGSLRRWMPALPLARNLAIAGLIVLIFNAALPGVYRYLLDTKIGTKPTVGIAYETNELCWLVVLPLICALVNLLPCLRVDGKLLVQRRWFPVTLFSLWVMGTGLHLYALDYVYDFDLRRELLVPAVWVIAWTLYRRLDDFLPAFADKLRAPGLALPLLVSLAAAGAERRSVFFGLTILNAAAFSFVWFKNRDNRVALRLGLATFSMLIAAWPPEWGPAATELPLANSPAISAMIFLFLTAVLSRNPKAALGGAFAAAIAVGALCRHNEDAANWALQAGFTFILLHSLRWLDYEHVGTGFLRGLAGVAWVAHSFVWIRSGTAFWHPLALAVGILAIYCVVWFVLRVQVRVVVPVAAALVALCAPANFAAAQLQFTPVGFLAVGASFLLFAAGTVVAVTKHRWHQV